MSTQIKFNSTTPAAPAGARNVTYQHDSSDPVNISANVADMVGDAGSGGSDGLVPAPGSGDAAAGKYLKADGTWEVPPGTGSGPTFEDNEVVSGTIDGSNVTFTLAHAPSPASSLHLYRNINRIFPEVGSPLVGDFTLSGNTITMAVAPSIGDVLHADYRR